MTAHDYIDGGSGNDASLFGDAGDDVIRGGSGDDVASGGSGIDQIYGEGGRDTLFGDAGTDGSTDGQRLFGGSGADTLYAWSADTTSTGGIGDQLFGGDDNDFLYGNLQNELLMGQSGADVMVGDWAAGSDYFQNESATTLGGDDWLIGGSGQDQAYGGGGDDTIRGGSDGDWLEGQDGEDSLFGGSGIDFLILDVDPSYTVRGGDSFQGHGETTPDDNAIDVMLINGTQEDDIIRVAAAANGRMSVTYNGATLEADWTGNSGPLVEQFRIAGLGGNDDIRIDPSLDLSVLSSQSREFVTIIEGGPGERYAGRFVGARSHRRRPRQRYDFGTRRR